MINEANIPAALRDLPQWVLWKTIQRDKPTKVPFSINGSPAKANDPATWDGFDAVLEKFNAGGYDGIGFEFSGDDSFCGVDLDGCRDPQTGAVADWARAIILELDSYAEVSPSETGVKVFCIGTLPTKGGRKKELPEAPRVCDKTPAIEMYDHGRYFAVTGLRLRGPLEPQDRGAVIAKLCDQFWPQKVAEDFYSADAVTERARKYMAKVPPAVSGQSGHGATFHAACILVCGFNLEKSQALSVLAEWNQGCQPPWSDRELEHKIDDALKVPGDRGYLRNAQPETWGRVSVPKYEPPKPGRVVELTTLAEAAETYIERIQSGSTGLIDTGLPDLDYAIGGGIEAGEMIVLAARPSHGKSLVALQCVHNWTAAGLPVLFVTEEMSPLALGKRTLQYATSVPQEHWQSSIRDVSVHLRQYEVQRAECYLAAGCGTTDVVCETIARAVKEKDIKAAVVDYAQLLTSPGRSRYEQITATSAALRKAANEFKIPLLVLCQLNRQIETRTKFTPVMSDIKESGQFEQDADVIVFLVWPHRIDQNQNPHEFKFYICKNRNRPINQAVVKCRINPPRQMLESLRPQDMDNYEPAFDDWSATKD